MSDALRGAIDVHIHALPDVRPRKVDMIEAALAARDAGMRGIVFKSHHEPTAGLAWLTNRAIGAEIAYGGVVLNWYTGGLNADAVEATAALGGRIVWLPTFTAAHHLRIQAEPAERGLTVLDERGRLTGATLNVLDAVARHGLALATGHLSPEESLVLVPEARRRGVRAVVVTHPESSLVGMPAAMQRDLASFGEVYFDRCRMSGTGMGTRAAGADAVDRRYQMIREVGVETTLASTDYGQPDNPLPVAGLQQYWEELEARGLTAAEWDRMARANPALVLGLSAS
jgi:hypothetical protein